MQLSAVCMYVCMQCVPCFFHRSGKKRSASPPIGQRAKTKTKKKSKESCKQYNLNDSYDYSGWLQEFDSNLPGPSQDILQRHLLERYKPGDIFALFFNIEVIEFLCQATNALAKRLRGIKNGTHKSNNWRTVVPREMSNFIGLLLYMGLNPRNSYAAYWTKHKALQMPGFRRIMTLHRFLAIMKCLSCTPASAYDTLLGAAKTQLAGSVTKIKPFADMLIELWQKAFYPGREISVDESMIAFKGRCRFLQFVPNKPHKYGLKAWALCDARSGYVYNWELYTGRAGANGDASVSNVNIISTKNRDIVMRVCRPVYHKGHHLYMDSFFTSPDLCRELSEVGVGCCGTVRKNRIGIPELIKENANATNPAPTWRCVKKGLIRFVSWPDIKLKKQDKSELHKKRIIRKIVTVNICSTIHKGTIKYKKDNKKIKPGVVQMYTNFMGGVDKANSKISTYLLRHRTVKWWKKVFFYLLEVSYINSIILWRALEMQVEQSSGSGGKWRQMANDTFRIAVADSLIDCRKPSPRSTAPGAVKKRASFFTHMRAEIDGSPIACRECGKETKFACRQCMMPMCPMNCFEELHR